jgi:hypothetical protein
MKQVLRNLLGVRRIDNQVEVATSTAGRSAHGRKLMLNGLDRIRNVQELLTDPGTPTAKRLLDASIEFLSVNRFQHEWPSELQRAADGIKARLLSGGDVPSSIRAMDEAAVDDTAEELLLFAKRARQLGA